MIKYFQSFQKYQYSIFIYSSIIIYKDKNTQQMRPSFQDELQKRQLRHFNRKLVIEPKGQKQEKSKETSSQSSGQNKIYTIKSRQRSHTILQEKKHPQVENKHQIHGNENMFNHKSGGVLSQNHHQAQQQSFGSNFLLGVIGVGEGDQQSSSRISNLNANINNPTHNPNVNVGHKSVNSHRTINMSQEHAAAASSHQLASYRRTSNSQETSHRQLILAKKQQQQLQEDSPYKRVDASSQDRDNGRKFKVVPSSNDSRNNQTVVSMPNVQAASYGQKLLQPIDDSNVMSTQSAYNDTFMPKKLQAIFPPKTLNNSREKLSNTKSTIKTSNSESTLKSQKKKRRYSDEKNEKSEPRNQQQQQKNTNFAHKNLNFLQVMKDFNLPDLNSAKKTKQSESNHQVAVIKDYQMDSDESVQLQLQPIGNMSIMTTSPPLPAIVLDKSYTSAAKKESSKIRWQAVPIRCTDGQSISITPDLTPRHRMSPEQQDLPQQDSGRSNSSNDRPKQTTTAHKVFTPLDKFIQSKQVSLASSQENVTEDDEQDQQKKRLHSHQTLDVINHHSRPFMKNTNASVETLKQPSIFSRNNQAPVSVTVQDRILAQQKKQEIRTNSIYSKVRTMSKTNLKRPHNVVRSSTTTSLTSVTVVKSRAQPNQYPSQPYIPQQQTQQQLKGEPPKFKVKRRHDEKLKNFQLRLVNEERQRQQKELNDDNFVSKDLSSNEQTKGDLRQPTRLVLSKVPSIDGQKKVGIQPDPDSKHAREFLNYVQKIAPSKTATNSSDEVGGHGKAISIEQFATPSLQLLNNRKFVMNQPNEHYNNSSNEEVSTLERKYQMTGQKSELQKQLEYQATSIGKLASNVFAFGQRDDSPLRTLFGAGRSKDFKVMHQISANLDQIDGMNATPTSLEYIKKMIDHNAGASTIQLQNRTQDMVVTSTLSKHQSSGLHTRRTSNWQRLIKNIDKKAEKVSGTKTPLLRGSTDQSLNIPSQTQNQFSQKPNRRTLQQSSTVQHFRPTARQQINVPTKISNGVPIYGSIQTSLANSREQSPSQIQVQSRGIVAGRRFDISNEQLKSIASRERLKGGELVQNSRNKLLPLINLPNGSREGIKTQVQSPSRPAQYYPMALFEKDPQLNKSTDQSQNPLQEYNSGEILLQDEVSNEQAKPKNVREWKQVPIKEQSGVSLSRASSMSGFGTLSKDNIQANRLKGSIRRPSQQKILQSQDHSPNPQIEQTSKTPSLENNQLLNDNHSPNARYPLQNLANFADIKTDLITPIEDKSPLLNRYESTGKLSRNTVFIRTSISKPDVAKLVPQEILSTKNHNDHSEQVTYDQEDEDTSRSPLNSGEDNDEINQQFISDRNKASQQHHTALVSLDITSMKSSKEAQLIGAAKMLKKLQKQQQINKRKIASQTPTIQQKRVIQNDQVPSVLLGKVKNSNNTTPKQQNAKKLGQNTQIKSKTSLIESPKIRDKSQDVKKNFASPTFGGKKGNRSPNKRKAKLRLQQQNNVVSGWSTDRNSIKTDSAIELFENSVLVKNIVQANKSKNVSPGATTLPNMIVKDEYNTPEELDQLAQKVLQNRQMMQMQIKDEAQDVRNSTEISKVSIARKFIDKIQPSSKRSVPNKRGGDKSKFMNSRSSSASRPSRCNSKEERKNGNKVVPIHERINLIASVCTLSHPSAKLKSLKDDSSNVQTEHLLKQATSNKDQTIKGTPRHNVDLATDTFGEKTIDDDCKELDQANIDIDTTTPTKAEKPQQEKHQKEKPLEHAQGEIKIIKSLVKPINFDANQIDQDMSNNSYQSNPQPHLRHRSVVYTNPKSERNQANNAYKESKQPTFQDVVDQKASQQNFKYFSIVMDLKGKRHSSNELQPEPMNKSYTGEGTPSVKYQNHPSIAATHNSKHHKQPDKSLFEMNRASGQQYVASETSVSQKEQLVTEHSFDNGPRATIVMSQRNMFGVHSLKH